MMKSKLTMVAGVVLVSVLGSMLAGCAPVAAGRVGGQTVLPEIDVVQVKEHASEALKLAQEAKLDVQVMSTKFAEVDNRLILMSEEISSVSSAKIEEIENRLSLLVEAFRDLKAQVAALEARPAARPQTTTGGGPAATFSPRTASALLTSSEYDMYQKALQVFDAGNHEKARELLSEMLKKFPEGNYADRAHYWIGDAFYALGDYANAIASFNRVAKFDRSAKLDDAQYRVGMSYLRMGKGDLARDGLQKVIDNFPNSEYAARARKHLGALAKSQPGTVIE